MQTNANAANIVNTQMGTKSLIGRFQQCCDAGIMQIIVKRMSDASEASSNSED